MKPAAVILAVFAASVAAVPVGDKVEKRQAVNLFSILENLLHIKTCTGQKFGDCPKKLPYIGKRYISERKSVPREDIVSVDTNALMGARGL
ncbi:unnamed protein product [Clonostachys byssicola]|uniref:Uncharacterized protein n=1 Tax=Clonostachys byssicola TaxID=160290 RepID=A0A9N9UNS6_9HYPO|nr:unnamed protein product [Clonostachys byssicola]